MVHLSQSETTQVVKKVNCVIGTGYVGLVAGVVFADMGNDVTCCDIDGYKIAALKRGQVPIYEPGLDKLIAHNVQQGRLAFGTDLEAAVPGTEVVVLAVLRRPAPDGSADLRSTFWRPQKPPWRMPCLAGPCWSPNPPCRSAPATRSNT